MSSTYFHFIVKLNLKFNGFVSFFKVVGGASIPIFIKALFTVPHIDVDQKAVDFGNVQCGKCSKVCILLKNRSINYFK